MQLHPAERDRLDSLASYGVLDTPADPAYDALTALAAKVCGTPIAGVSLVAADRQWFKSLYGWGISETSREASFCSDAVAAGTLFVVPDATVDPRYRDNPQVTGETGIRAYAAVPLTGRDGLPLGALCVIDRRPRDFSGEQLALLAGLARQAVALLEQDRRDRAEGLLADSMLEEARDPIRLRKALEDGELVPHYQPVVDLSSGRAVGFEALLRWEHPQHGTLPPAAFLPAIEAGALVVPVGRAVLDASLSQLARLSRQAGSSPVAGVAVNVGSGQLARPGLARDVLSALAAHQIAPASLHLEITEATALPDLDVAAAELSELVAAGVHIVVDDFGVGWSNLTRVLELPVSALKLDRSLAGAVLRDRRAAAMVVSTVALAAELGLQVVAEGVETEPVREFLTRAGCRWGQGWLFSAAVPGHRLPQTLTRLGTDADPTTGTPAVPVQQARPAPAGHTRHHG